MAERKKYMLVDPDINDLNLLIEVQNTIKKIKELEEVSGYKIADLTKRFLNKEIVIQE